MTDDFRELLRPYLRYAGDQEITSDTRLRDLGLDSMHAIELLFAIEDRYGITVPDNMLGDQTFETAGSLWAAVDALRPTSDASLR